MTEGSSPDHAEPLAGTDVPSGADLIDGTPGNDRPDGGEQDTVLLTDDDAQRDDEVTRPANS